MRRGQAKYNNLSELLSNTYGIAGGCTFWAGAKNYEGYGAVSHRGKTVGAHRLAWIMAHGPIPADMVVMHLCDTPACVNPAHLQLGSTQENTADRQAKNRQAQGDMCGRRKYPDRYRNASKYGTTNPSAKLTEVGVRAIRADTRSHQAVADSYGLCKTTIRKVRAGVLWAHVPMAITLKAAAEK